MFWSWWSTIMERLTWASPCSSDNSDTGEFLIMILIQIDGITSDWFKSHKWSCICFVMCSARVRPSWREPCWRWKKEWRGVQVFLKIWRGLTSTNERLLVEIRDYYMSAIDFKKRAYFYIFIPSFYYIYILICKFIIEEAILLYKPKPMSVLSSVRKHVPSPFLVHKCTQTAQLHVIEKTCCRLLDWRATNPERSHWTRFQIALDGSHQKRLDIIIHLVL
jgi:hypothetical protein